jgi:hypothetical protein|nr:MAG TPA: Receptor Binding Protein [Caudoviricetes sp.]
MGQKSGFFNSVNGDRRYNAEDIGRMFDGIIRDGVFANYKEAFAVSPGPGLSVKVGSGRCWFNHRWYESDETFVLGLNDAHNTYSRIDTVCIEVNEAVEARYARLRILTGVPSSAPVTPEGENTDTLHQYPIAMITVKANASSIDATVIRDNRGGSACPWVVAPVTRIDTTKVFADIRKEWEEWFSGVKQAALNPPDANVELATLKKSVATLLRKWDPVNITQETPDSASAVTFINRAFDVKSVPFAGLSYASFGTEPSLHNILFRGRLLGETMSTAQQRAIKDGSFTDLWIGDYWLRNNVRYVVAGFNYWLGQSGITDNHIVVLAQNLFNSVRFNTGPMSNVRNTSIISDTIETVGLNRFKDVFGSDKLMRRSHNYTTGFDDGVGIPNNVSTANVLVSLMQPPMVSTSGVGAIIRDNYTINYFNDTMILPLFILKPDWRNTLSNHWLNYVYNKNYASVVGTNGSISAVGVTTSAACYPIAAVKG